MDRELELQLRKLETILELIAAFAVVELDGEQSHTLENLVRSGKKYYGEIAHHLNLKIWT